ncbi:hypothetical protein FS837_001163 [Tulasnella sp. UAMH 9824]|nr:hypothetical protein FS837_001163 [Tulasnella sp. UAMH 9824]
MRSFATLSVVLAASTAVLASPSANVSLNPRDLATRQASSDCYAACQPATEKLSKCGTGSGEISCLCSPDIAPDYTACHKCGYDNAPADMKSTLEQRLQEYIQACKDAGMPVSVTSFTGSSSSSSSTGSNSNPNSNTNTNTNSNSNTGSSSSLNGSSSGNNAFRSTSLGSVGLGALALAVSSLF